MTATSATRVVPEPPASGTSDLARHKALLKAQALQQAVLTSADFSIIATDDRGVIQLFNVGAERMLGYAAAEMIDRISPSDIHDPAEVLARAEGLSLELGVPIAPGFEALAYKASRQIRDIYELTYICKDGSRFPAIISITALRGDAGEIIGYLLIGTDNSVRKRFESELNAAMQAADSANRAKSDFLSSMSHELRTPLNAILGFAQLLESGTPPPTIIQKRNVQQILKAGWYLLELINEVLDLAVIESGRFTLSKEPVSVAEVLAECRAMVEPQARDRNIAMSFPACFDQPCYISADRIRVKQVLINLLFNAIKYNRPDGRVTVDFVQTAARTLRINVRDTGAGLPPEKLAQLFQPFNRLGQHVGSEQGTGIGLVVTKRLVEVMGGTIGVESTVGDGSIFWVELGLAAAPQLAPPAEGEHPSALRAPRVDAPLRTVLYVEDNPANLELVEQLVARRSDLRLLSAADGSLGLEYARTSLPAVILMDVNLPGMSGTDAMLILRADPGTAHIPIIALSANAVPRDIQSALDAGFFNYITKPIMVSQFMDALDAALAVSPANARGEA
jgi:signal transduction histidine kinase/ActR/RegA family two-component response regulator